MLNHEDEVLFFYRVAGAGQGIHYRRLEHWDQEQERVLVFLTNHLDLAALAAAGYEDRWRIERFLKALKQSLRVKTLVATSANALKTQIWRALIAILVVRCPELRASFRWSLSGLVALLQ